MSNELADSRALLEGAFQRAVNAASPRVCVEAGLRGIDPDQPALVLGAGKAAAAMAAALRAAWAGPVRGLVVTRYGHGLAPVEDRRADTDGLKGIDAGPDGIEGIDAEPGGIEGIDADTGGIEVVEAAHPSPDQASVSAGARLLELAQGIRPDERLVALISGGGSSLACAPLDGVPVERKRDAAGFLIRAGADIREINCVRKHLSGLKGGRLAAAARPADLLTLVISDVPGDDPRDVASGPTLPDPTSQRDALAILDGYRYPALDALRGVLADPRYETPKPEDRQFAGDDVRLIATGETGLDAAEAYLIHRGFRVLRLGADLDGEAVALGREHARLALEQQHGGEPVAVLSGGETRVVLGGSTDARPREGRGGRNLEYLSGLALELAGAPGIYALAADTDGIDGNGDHAGGIVTPELLARGDRLGLSLESLLAGHDTYRFFDACGALVRTGPTRTNVNDFRLIVCRPRHYKDPG